MHKGRGGGERRENEKFAHVHTMGRKVRKKAFIIIEHVNDSFAIAGIFYN